MKRILVVNFSDSEIDTQKIYINDEELHSVIDLLTFIQDYCRDHAILDPSSQSISHLEYLEKNSGKFITLSDDIVDTFFDKSSNSLSSRLFSILVLLQSSHPDSSSSSSSSQFKAIGGRKFSQLNPVCIHGKPIRIEEEENAHLGTGLKTWDGSVVLAKYFEANPSLISNKTVLELGAGTGLAGIAAAMLQASQVVLTDLEYSLKNLEINVQKNQESIMSSSVVEIKVLDWTDPTTYPSSNVHWDVVIGADIVWLDHLIPPLVSTLDYCCSKDTIFYLAYQNRSMIQQKILFDSLTRLFTMEELSRETYPSEYKDSKIHIYKLCKLS